MFAFVVALVTSTASAEQIVGFAANCDQGTTYDMRMCWSKQDDAAAVALKSTYAEVTAAFRKSGRSIEPLADAQAAWVEARDKTCAFEYQQYLPGTIAPQLGVECDVRMTRARTKRLAALVKNSTRSSEQPISTAAAGELEHVYRLYLARLARPLQLSFASAELAWISYRDKACAVEGGTCLTQLTNERIAELKASWVGEVFW